MSEYYNLSTYELTPEQEHQEHIMFLKHLSRVNQNVRSRPPSGGETQPILIEESDFNIQIEQLKIENNLLKDENQVLKEEIKSQQEQIHQLKQQLTTISSHTTSAEIKINEAKNHSDPDNGIICAICQDNAKGPVMLDCNHLFCYDCLVESSKSFYSRCPLCRAPCVIPHRSNFFQKVV